MFATTSARCYFCKRRNYSRIEQLLPGSGARVICSGANLDDKGDYRPGLKQRRNTRTPSRSSKPAAPKPMSEPWPGVGLPTWDKPASPCLSSRSPLASSNA